MGMEGRARAVLAVLRALTEEGVSGEERSEEERLELLERRVERYGGALRRIVELEGERVVAPEVMWIVQEALRE